MGVLDGKVAMMMSNVFLLCFLILILDEKVAMMMMMSNIFLLCFLILVFDLFHNFYKFGISLYCMHYDLSLEMDGDLFVMYFG